MKKLIMIFTLVAGSALFVNAQEKLNEKDVPQTVKSAFSTAYADASEVEWKSKEGNYKAKFDWNGEDHFAEFSNSGELISKGTEINKDQLPAPVAAAVKTSAANKEIDEVYKVEKGNEIHYLVKLNGEPDKAQIYSADGKLIKEKIKK